MSDNSVYPQALRESIQRIERTRKQRINQDIARLSLDERELLLREFHPDYRAEMFRELTVGVERGTRAPHEFVDLFEAYSIISEKDVDLSSPDYTTDVLIIGGGGAGVSAALTAQESGVQVLLATKLRVGDANTMMAQGGIQAADKEGDSPTIHYLDVVGGGGFHNVPELVRALVIDAPSAIGWLENLGVMFDKEADGTMVTIHGGGTSRKRMHSARDYSGGEIMKTLRDELNNRGIQVVEFAPACELLTDGSQCTGAILYNMETGGYSVVRAKTTILATGGSGRLHVQKFPTTNHYGATADGLVLAYRAGCGLLFVDTIQYHPTGAAFPEQIVGLLVTEKVRGLGAQLVNYEGDRFIYELETRDVEAAAIIRECRQRKKGVQLSTGMQGVWLDSPIIEMKLGKGAIQKMLPAMYRQYKRFDIDITEEPMLVYPTQHYQNGGLKIDEHCRTDLRNLYAAGEVSGGVHGRNRLMGNSLLDIIVFGRRAGDEAARAAKSIDINTLRLSLEHLQGYHQQLEEQGIPRTRRSPILLPDYRREKTRSASLLDGV